MKAAICQKHCEKLWGIHWKQMGFFSFNSEILSLSDTIKTNRGRRGMLSNRNTGWFEPSSWAPRVGPGRGPTGGGVGDLAGPLGALRLHPGAPDRFANWWARSSGKCPLFQTRASPAPPPPGPLNDASQDPPFSDGGTHPRPLRPPRRAPSQCRPSPVPPPRVPAGIHRAFGGAR